MPDALPAQSVDHRAVAGPFDIIGDVHGCADELIDLLGKLGHAVALTGTGEKRRASIEVASGRKVIFVGDFVDRGPSSPDVLRIAMAMHRQGTALAVPGNHDDKFARWLKGRQVQLTHGLDRTVEQFAAEPKAFHEEVRAFIEALPIYLWLDSGRLAVAHAGIEQDMLGQPLHGKTGGRIRSFCLYGDTDGVTDEHGLAMRYDWAQRHDGPTRIVYGHTPIGETEWRNNTLCLDTGCVFGGALSALRWPENEIVSVPARTLYSERKRPFGHPRPRP